MIDELFEVTLPFGGRELTLLYSMPNVPNSNETLEQTVSYWIAQTLQHDRFAEKAQVDEKSIRVEVGVGTATTDIKVSGRSLAPRSSKYAFDYGSLFEARLTSMLVHGRDAHEYIFSKLKSKKNPNKDNKRYWDPYENEHPKPYSPWRLFLGHGLPLVNSKSVHLFHYPPIRLLEGTRNYLVDPVPTRWEHLLWLNGVEKNELTLYEAVVDTVPIAAEDDQGSGDYSSIPDTIPFFFFNENSDCCDDDYCEYDDYTGRQLRQMLACSTDYTVPVVIYGRHVVPRFEKLFNTKLNGKLAAVQVQIIPGKTTAVLACGHPYNFYYKAQQYGDAKVGSGKIHPKADRNALATIMAIDLIAARWQMKMAEKPDSNPSDVLAECRLAWEVGENWEINEGSSLRRLIDYMVDFHGSLYYPSPDASDPKEKYRYEFRNGAMWPDEKLLPPLESLAIPL